MLFVLAMSGVLVFLASAVENSVDRVRGWDSPSPPKLRCILELCLCNSLLLFKQYPIVKEQYLGYIST